MTIARGWWERPGVIAALVLSVTLPLWVGSPPPLIDLLTHMARYRVQIDIAHSPLLQRNWQFHWALIGNLGVDMLVWPLAKAIGLERATWWIVAAIPAMFAWGMMRTAHAIHGRIPATALAALPFALAYPYQFGFVNFWLGTALAFHALASWPRTTATGRHWLVFAPTALLIWLCHAFAWGVLGVLAGSYELARGIAERPLRPVALTGRVLARCAPLLLPAIPMLLWRQGNGLALRGWFHWEVKLGWLAYVLRDQSLWLDVGSTGAVLMLLCIGLISPRLRFDARLGIASLFFLLLFLLMPSTIFGSSYADARLMPVILVTATLAITSASADRQLERWIAAFAVVVLALRLVVGVVGFAEYDHRFASNLRALDHIRRGSKIVALVKYSCDEPWRSRRDQHLASLAVVRREAFVNTHWNIPGAELLVPRGAVSTAFNADPSQFLVTGDCTNGALAKRLGEVPRSVFDYVWVFGFDPARLPSYPGLRPLYADRSSILYAIAGKGERR